MWKRVSIVLFSIVLGSCSIADDSGFYIVNYDVDFSQSLDNWAVDFADYPASEDDSIKCELKTSVTQLPTSTNLTRNALFVSGNNSHGDLFMFLKRKVGGLTPNTEYTIVFDVTMASNAPTGLFDGNAQLSPGQGVFLKVGAVSRTPVKVIQSDYYRMNIDKGDGSTGGSDMVTIGDIGVAPSTSDFTVITRSSSEANTPIVVRTNANGELWLVVGTDSVFMGTTTLYYSKIDVVLSANGQ